MNCEVASRQRFQRLRRDLLRELPIRHSMVSPVRWQYNYRRVVVHYPFPEVLSLFQGYAHSALVYILPVHHSNALRVLDHERTSELKRVNI